LFTRAEVIYKPHGVVGLITPWNYPFLLGIADALPALLAGNAVIVKPSEITPLSAMLARDLLVECGLDPDLAIIVNGGGDAGAELIRWVDYVGFTGGTETGRKVALAAAGRLIPFSLELGGKNPMIVLPGASLQDAATGLMTGAFSNSGQTCISIERVYVHYSIYDAFARRLVESTSRLKLGWSKNWDMDVGSLISAPHAEKVLARIQEAIGSGAEVLAGGKRRTDLGPAFVEPTVLAGAGDAMRISREETFGPVVTLYPVRDVDEAIARANDSEFGLNASIWTGDRAHARSLARRIEAGSVVVNSTLLIYSSYDVPMGGVKRSGIGRRHGEQGILKYTQAQSVVGSIESGGGYDALLARIRSERIAKAALAVMKAWRRVPW
jgi:succinate-semialdehyde dehydrogenase/glutarate-semialdehyde dehydrogenase